MLAPQMGGTAASWPRGFPLEAIKDLRTKTAPFKRKSFPLRRIGVVQSLANNDPDVDAIFRLTQPIPFDFREDPSHQVAPRRPRAAIALQTTETQGETNVNNY